MTHAVFVLNGKMYSEAVTEYGLLDQITLEVKVWYTAELRKIYEEMTQR